MPSALPDGLPRGQALAEDRQVAGDGTDELVGRPAAMLLLRCTSNRGMRSVYGTDTPLHPPSQHCHVPGPECRRGQDAGRVLQAASSGELRILPPARQLPVPRAVSDLSCDERLHRG